MANWVLNTISNYTKELYEKYKNEDRDIDFNKIIPEPEEVTNSHDGICLDLLKAREKYGTNNWYDWRTKNWGTKWNACNTEYNEEKQILKFNTAWGIPEPIFTKIAQDNPNEKLDIRSEEETGLFIKFEIKDDKLFPTAIREITYSDKQNV